MGKLLCCNSNKRNCEFSDLSDYMFELFSCFCPDALKRRKFLQCLFLFSSNQFEAIARRELLKAFINSPATYDCISANSNILNKSFDDFNELRRRIRFSADDDPVSQCYRKVGELQSAASALKGMLTALQEISAGIKTLTTPPKLLDELLSEISNITDNSEFNNLMNTLDLIEGFQPEESDFQLLVEIDNNGKLLNANIDFIDYGKTIGRRMQYNHDYYVLLRDSCDNALRIITSYIQMIHSEFEHLNDDLLFYNTALRYCKYLDTHRFPHTFPTFKNYVRIKSLKDFFLLANSRNKDRVIPNDFISYPPKAIVITGENASGKTVFLRSIYFALLFGRAGLPIPAEEATIVLYNHINIVFSADDVKTLSKMGRFEKEVEILSNIFYTIEHDSIVLLNEVFQSTSYTEAANSLSHIIEAFLKKQTTCILVTHLSDLPKLLNEKCTEVYISSSDEAQRYKILKSLSMF